MKENENIKVLTGDEAHRVLCEILESERKSRSLTFPAHIGAVGYFLDKSGKGDPLFTAFDNSSGDCWVEDFKTREGAEKWCRCELNTDEVNELESNVEGIILHKDSFPALREEGSSITADCPPYVEFDESGEMNIAMQFYDGYAFDTNLHELGVHDRIALYYPTVDEVAKRPDLQEAIDAYTGRRWAEGSRQEQIYDIALKYGEASRVHCPQERFDAAVMAIVERAADPSAKAFTPEQRGMIQLAAGCNGEFFFTPGSMRETFYDSLFAHAQQQMQRVPIAWANDAHQELKELANDQVRNQGLGLRR